MKQATISMPDDLREALDEYLRDQDNSSNLAAVAQTALREYLAERGYLPRARALRITPAAHGSGSEDGSIDHDRYLAGA